MMAEKQGPPASPAPPQFAGPAGPPPPRSPINNRAPRNSDVSSQARRSHAEELEPCKLSVVYEPIKSSGPKPPTNVDIVAVHGFSERSGSKSADSTWTFVPPQRIRPTNLAGGIRNSSFLPGISSIAEGSVYFVKRTVVDSYGRLPGPLHSQKPTPTAPPTAPPTPIDLKQGTPKQKSKQNVQSSTSSLHSEETESPPAPSVNWLRDEGMLPRSFPLARIMQFSYPFSLLSNSGFVLKDIAEELLQKLSESRLNDKVGPGLSRPIIFIGHSIGGLVISEALIMAKEGEFSAVVDATVGVLFLGTPFKGSTSVARRLQAASPRRVGSIMRRSPLGKSGDAKPAAANTTSPGQTDKKPLYTLLDTNTTNLAILKALVTRVEEIVEEKNIYVACFAEKLETDGPKPHSKELLVNENSATLGASPSTKYTIVKLQCTHTNLSKFRGPEDPSFVEVKKIIKEEIDFTTTRRFWDSISRRNEEDVKKQLVQGAKLNKGNSRKRNSLHLATIAGKLEIVILLLDRGVAVNAKDLDKCGPIHYALMDSKYEILKALLKRGAKIDDKEKERVTDEKCLKLLADIRYFQGPRVNPKKQEALPAFPKDKLPLACDLDKYMGTITTFHLRSAKDTEEEIKNNTSTRLADSKVAVEDETEFHWREKVPVGRMLFPESDEDVKGNVTSDKQWKWYHLPANNLDWVEALFARLKIDNTNGRLSGQEHRGHFPHSSFLQPQASVFRTEHNGENDIALFMPYLHFETNEGRIKLTNAVRRGTESASSTEKGASDDNMSETTESTSNAKRFAADVEDSTDSDEEEDPPKGSAAVDANELKAKFRHFQKALSLHGKKLRSDATSKPSDDEMLVEAYLTEKYLTDHGTLRSPRLHIRRTLDQFYYIGLKDTEHRDLSQVVQRYALKTIDIGDGPNESAEKKLYEEKLIECKLIMVDQLWLWVLGKNTVITSFPRGWGERGGLDDKHPGVLEQIQRYLQDPKRDPIKSANALAAVIINECTRVFSRFQDPYFPELQFLDFFDASISDLGKRYSNILEKLDLQWDDISDIHPGRDRQKKKTKAEKKIEKEKAKRRKALKEFQLNINEEIELLVEIEDIQDELNIIKLVLDDQHSVLSEGNQDTTQKQPESPILRPTFDRIDGKPVDNHVEVNRKTIANMITRAKEIHTAVHHLVDLKQKQANVAEAKYAARESRAVAKEGRTILALTIVNMIFLPLSFMSSFFALDIAEFPKFHLGWVSKYIFGISFAIAIPSILIAMAIGPLADPTKKVVLYIAHWSFKILRKLWDVTTPVLWVLLGIILLALIIALIPVAAALIIAAGAIVIVVLIVAYAGTFVFYLFQALWECTPYYKRKHRSKNGKRPDEEDVPVPPDATGDEGTENEKGPPVVDSRALEQEN